ncbi:MAG: hypothetical protein J6Z43_06295 [Clostridiales bacterium]|nr:hypothetical protein [Clostridiales bacterium]
MKLNSIPVRKIIVYLLYILLIPSIQITMCSKYAIIGQTADLMLVFAVLTGFLYGFREGMIIGGLVGLIRDIFASPVIAGADNSLSLSFGLGMLVMFLAGVFGAIFFEGRTNRNFPLGVLAVFIFTLLYKTAGHLAVYIWNSAFIGGVNAPDIAVILRDSVLISVLLNAAASVPLYFLLKYLGPVRSSGKQTSGKKELTYGDSGKWLTI